MKALISPNEGNRIVEVASLSFPVADPLFWVDCPDNINEGWTFNQNGTFTEPPVPVQEIPSIVTMRQARLALLSAGYLDSINNYMATSAGAAAKIEWEYAAEVDRNSPLVANLATMLNLSGAQLDDLFVMANSL